MRLLCYYPFLYHELLGRVKDLSQLNVFVSFDKSLHVEMLEVCFVYFLERCVGFEEFFKLCGFECCPYWGLGVLICVFCCLCLYGLDRFELWAA